MKIGELLLRRPQTTILAAGVTVLVASLGVAWAAGSAPRTTVATAETTTLVPEPSSTAAEPARTPEPEVPAPTVSEPTAEPTAQAVPEAVAEEPQAAAAAPLTAEGVVPPPSDVSPVVWPRVTDFYWAPDGQPVCPYEGGGTGTARFQYHAEDATHVEIALAATESDGQAPESALVVQAGALPTSGTTTLRLPCSDGPASLYYTVRVTAWNQATSTSSYLWGYGASVVEP